MSHGYHQIALAPESRYISTFVTHEGMHRFKVLFFGAKPASDIFHAKVSAALSGLPGVISLHDNILVWGTTPEEHLHNLEACLTRLKEKGLTLRKEKCTFGKTSISWFGYVFSKSGMSADPDKIKAIKLEGKPGSKDEVKSFLQACQFNARFMYDSDKAYAQLTKPLRMLTHKNARFNWTSDCQEAYDAIMKAMTSENALHPFDPKRRTIHVSDAGPEGLAARIFQVDEETGDWLPIDHTSRSLTDTEEKYSQIEKEALAQSWGMDMFRYYLLGAPFDSYTDHMPLVSIYNDGKRGNARVERLRIKVQGMEYTMKHLPGKQNPCDYASRHPKPLASFSQKERDSMIIDDGTELCINSIITSDLPDAVTLKMVQVATAKDPVMQKLIACLRQGYSTNDPDIQPYKQIFTELAYENGVILRGDRLLIPGETDALNLRQMVVDNAHEGHQGEVKSKQLLRSRLWFPGIDKMVEDKITSCLGCQATTYTPHRDPLIPTEMPDEPWQKIDMDFWGPTPGGEYVLAIVDEYSRWPALEFVSSTGGAAVIPVLDKIFSEFGFPEEIKTDGGPPFNGHEFARYCEWIGSKHKKVTPEDPEANGLAENFMKSIGKVFHIAKIEGKKWKQEMYKFLRHYRSTPHSTTGKTPMELMMKRKANLRIPSAPKPVNTQDETDRQARATDSANKEKQKMYKDNKRTVRPHDFKINQKVLLLQKKTKLRPQYDPNPFTIVKILGRQIHVLRADGTFRIRDASKFKPAPTTPPRHYPSSLLSQNSASMDFSFHQAAAPARPRQVAPAPPRQAAPAPPRQAAPVQPRQAAPGPPRQAAPGQPRQAAPVVPPRLEPGWLPGGWARVRPLGREERSTDHEQRNHREIPRHTYRYPNGHLDPDIDINLPRESRNRRSPDWYDAASGGP